MDFLRTLKKRRPKSHVKQRLSIAPTKGYRPRSRRIHTKRRRTGLNLAVCFALFVGLAVVTQADGEDHYIYHDPNKKLFISNQEPLPGSKIIKQLNLPESKQSQESIKPQANGQAEGSPMPSKSK
jgi:hypothetical protein